MAEINKEKVLKTFSPRNITIAMVLGLGVTGYMLYSSLSNGGNLWDQVSNPSIFWIFMILVTIVGRDLGYMYRIRQITDKKLSWRSSFNVILLWEFASAVTPSVVGGTMVAIFILNGEGIKTGKAAAYVTYTAVLDNMFFLVVLPLVIWYTGWDVIPRHLEYRNVLIYAFKGSYIFILCNNILMGLGVLVFPLFFKRFLYKSTRWFRMGRKLSRRIIRFGSELYMASKEMRGKGFSYHFKAVMSTLFVWCSRYFILNCVFAAFVMNTPKKASFDHAETWSKQAIIWVTQLVSPTPGASGFSERIVNYMFDGSFDSTLVTKNGPILDSAGNPIASNDPAIINPIKEEYKEKDIDVGFKDEVFNTAMGFLWRLITFYPYLIIGVIILPRWLKRAIGGDSKEDKDNRARGPDPQTG